MQLALEATSNSIYSRIDGLDSKEALELTSLKANPLICKNFTFKSLDKDKTGFTGVMANNSMSPIINENDIFTGSFFTNPEDFTEGKLYVVYLKDNFSIYVAVKKVFRGNLGELVLKSSGGNYKDIRINCNPEEIIIARLTSLYRIF
jgi:hypothetical protein